MGVLLSGWGMGLGVVILLVLGVMALVFTIQSLLIIVPPNRVAIITGQKRVLPSGQRVGYRVVRGGRTIRIPFLEEVAWMELNTIPLQIQVNNAIAKGGIPIDVQAVANLKIASSPEDVFSNAVERLLGNQNQIKVLAQETLAANLRGVLSTLTPEEANEDRVKFEGALMNEVTRDLAKLGLQLDMLKIQSISDEAGYLRAYGRIRTAEVLRDAQNAEANTKSETEVTAAMAEQKSAVARSQAKMEMASAENELRLRQAALNREAVIAERTALAAADEAQALAELQVERARVEVTRVRLQVEQVEPAKAAIEVAEANARAGAATIVAQGEAQAKAMSLVQEQLKAGGEEGLRALLLQQLPAMVETMAKAASATRIDRLVVMGGHGEGGARTAVNQRLGVMSAIFEGACAQYGLDPEMVMKALVLKDGTTSPPAAEHGAAPITTP